MQACLLPRVVVANEIADALVRQHLSYAREDLAVEFVRLFEQALLLSCPFVDFGRVLLHEQFTGRGLVFTDLQNGQGLFFVHAMLSTSEIDVVDEIVVENQICRSPEENGIVICGERRGIQRWNVRLVRRAFANSDIAIGCRRRVDLRLVSMNWTSSRESASISSCFVFLL